MVDIDKKSTKVEAMFNGIASKYDFLNHFLSLGIDKLWRKRLVRQAAAGNPSLVLDIATGTADLAIALSKYSPNVRIVGVDIAANMLSVGEKKLLKRKLSNQISLQQASSMELPFTDSTFDLAMVAFGVRNFEDVSKGIAETYRVLKSKGKFYVLEFSIPTKFPMAQLYRFYFRYLLPFIGGLFSGNRHAYKYLPESVMEFPQKGKFLSIMESVGFVNCRYQQLTFGIATIYIGERL